MEVPKLSDDLLFDLMYLPQILIHHRIIKKISYFCYGSIILMTVAQFLVIALTNQSYLLLTQYSAVISGLCMVFTSYVTLYGSTSKKRFSDIYCDFFPSLWPLRSLGKTGFQSFQKLSKMVKVVAILAVAFSLLSATLGLPWYGDEYDVYLPVKTAVDYHFSLTILANVFTLFYLVLHLYNQFRLLNIRLTNLSKHQDVEYHQDFVTRELVSCIKHHQKLLEYTKKLNTLLYYPIFYYTVSGIFLALSLILLPKTSASNVLRVVFLSIESTCLTAGICFCGQYLVDESGRTFTCSYNAQWYSWNTKNKVLLQLLLVKSMNSAVMTSSGLITINNELLIRMYRAIYSTVMFIIHVYFKH